jgi:acyl-CoA thioesterase I
MMQKEVSRRQILREAKRLGALLALGAAIGPALGQERRPRLMLFGDSLMAGLGLPAEDAFAARLAAALEEAGHPVEIVNASVSGDTAADGLARLDWSLGEKPDAVFLELGANDMLQGLPVTETRDNLEAILNRLATERLPVLLAGMLASPRLGPDYEEAYNGMFRQLAARYMVPLVPFFLEGVATESTLNQADGIHPNAEGVRIIVANVLPQVTELVQRVTGG